MKIIINGNMQEVSEIEIEVKNDIGAVQTLTVTDADCDQLCATENNSFAFGGVQITCENGLSVVPRNSTTVEVG